MAQIQDLGILKRVAGDNGTTKNAWSGAISLALALEANPAMHEILQRAMNRLPSYMVAADPAAPTRCIDGRQVVNFASDPERQHRSLGPEITGGTNGVALAWRFAEGMNAQATFINDLQTVIEKLSAAHIGIGDHIDEHHAPNEEDTGCGAVDKMLVIIERIVQPSAATQVATLAGSLLSPAYIALARELLTNVAHALPGINMYLGRSDGRYTFKQQSVRLLQAKSPGAVEMLIGTHQEKGLLINTAVDTTFNRDQFSLDHNGDIQLFDYDAWFVQSLAGVLFPNDVKKRRVFVLFHVLYSIATAMVLTDGSLRLLLCTA